MLNTILNTQYLTHYMIMIIKNNAPIIENEWSLSNASWMIVPKRWPPWVELDGLHFDFEAKLIHKWYRTLLFSLSQFIELYFSISDNVQHQVAPLCCFLISQLRAVFNFIRLITNRAPKENLMASQLSREFAATCDPGIWSRYHVS